MSDNTAKGQGQASGESDASPSSETQTPAVKPVWERIEKGAHKGPADPKPAQPQQMINPRPTNQQQGRDSGQQSDSAGGGDEG